MKVTSWKTRRRHRSKSFSPPILRLLVSGLIFQSVIMDFFRGGKYGKFSRVVCSSVTSTSCPPPTPGRLPRRAKPGLATQKEPNHQPWRAPNKRRQSLELHDLEVLSLSLCLALQLNWIEKVKWRQNAELAKAFADERVEAGKLFMPRLEDSHCPDAKKPRICSKSNRWLTRKVFDET